MERGRRIAASRGVRPADQSPRVIWRGPHLDGSKRMARIRMLGPRLLGISHDCRRYSRLTSVLLLLARQWAGLVVWSWLIESRGGGSRRHSPRSRFTVRRCAPVHVQGSVGQGPEAQSRRSRTHVAMASRARHFRALRRGQDWCTPPSSARSMPGISASPRAVVSAELEGSTLTREGMSVNLARTKLPVRRGPER